MSSYVNSLATQLVLADPSLAQLIQPHLPFTNLAKRKPAELIHPFNCEMSALDVKDNILWSRCVDILWFSPPYCTHLLCPLGGGLVRGGEQRKYLLLQASKTYGAHGINVVQLASFRKFLS